jgi:hypothetical protein
MGAEPAFRNQCAAALYTTPQTTIAINATMHANFGIKLADLLFIF